MSSVWHERLREAEERRFQSTPLPGSKSENFRFTSLEGVPALMTKTMASDPAPQQLSEKSSDEKACLLFHGGRAYGERVETKPLHFSDLESALAKEEELLKSVLTKTESMAADKFALLAKARWENGGFLRVAKGEQVSLPLRITHWVSKAQGLYAFRTVLILEEGASATVVEEFSGDGEHSGMVAGLIEARLAPGSKLKYVQVQNLGKSSEFFIRQEFTCAENAQAKVVPFYAGGKKGQLRHDAHLLGKGASVSVKGAARGRKEQHFDFWLNAFHPNEHTRSELDFWFVMADQSRAIFNGLLDIKKTGLHTEAYQKNRSLLLSSQATVHTVPRLLIATDQVRCSHGASVSTLNPEQVYYLQSRGLPRVEAERMIVRGFTQPVLDEVPIEKVFERARGALSDGEEVLP